MKNILYNIRRKIQYNLTRITSYEFMTKIYYHYVYRKKIDLDNPKTFSEKIHWLKLYYFPDDNKVLDATDKFKVRDYVRNKGLEPYLNELYGVYNTWHDIDWNELPNKFVIKVNNGCAYNILCDDKEKMNKKPIKKKVTRWLEEDFSLYNAEKHYSKIQPKIIIEKHLGNDIFDYKFFCFDGEPKFYYASRGWYTGDVELDFFNLDGTYTPFKRNSKYKELDGVKVPYNLKKMIELSKILSEDFPFVRVDFFEIDGIIYFSELTFTPGGGFMDFKPDEYNLLIGDWIPSKYFK